MKTRLDGARILRQPNGNPKPAMEASTPYDVVVERVEKTLQSFFDSPDDFTYDLHDLHLKVVLQGPKWSGVVDKVTAKFLLDLDQVLNEQLLELGIDLPKSKHGLVALRVDEGSLEVWVEHGQGILETIKQMDPKIQFMILLTILTSVGVFGAARLLKVLNEPKLEKLKAEKDVETIEAVGRVVEKVMDRQRELQAPVRSLINKMGDADMISLPAEPVALGKKAAKKTLVKGTRSKVKTFYVDHPYIVQELRTPKPDEWKIGLVFGDQSFTAELSLTEPQIQELLESFQLAHESGQMIAPHMHVNMRVNAKGIRKAVVVGLGARRENSITLPEALRAGAAEIDEAYGDEEAAGDE